MLPGKTKNIRLESVKSGGKIRRMFERSCVEIDGKRSAEFAEFVKENAKGKEFWEHNKETASREIAKNEIDSLFREKRAGTNS